MTRHSYEAKKQVLARFRVRTVERMDEYVKKNQPKKERYYSTETLSRNAVIARAVEEFLEKHMPEKERSRKESRR